MVFFWGGGFFGGVNFWFGVELCYCLCYKMWFRLMDKLFFGSNYVCDHK